MFLSFFRCTRDRIIVTTNAFVFPYKYIYIHVDVSLFFDSIEFHQLADQRTDIVRLSIMLLYNFLLCTSVQTFSFVSRFISIAPAATAIVRKRRPRRFSGIPRAIQREYDTPDNDTPNDKCLISNMYKCIPSKSQSTFQQGHFHARNKSTISFLRTPSRPRPGARFSTNPQVRTGRGSA
jgi:hypothetical protein